MKTLTKEDIKLIDSLKTICHGEKSKVYDSHDIMQDVYIKILRNIDKFETLTKEEKTNYTAVAVFNVIRDSYRKKKIPEIFLK